MQNSSRCQPDYRRICFGETVEKRSHHDSRRRARHEVFEEIAELVDIYGKNVKYRLIKDSIRRYIGVYANLDNGLYRHFCWNN